MYIVIIIILNLKKHIGDIKKNKNIINKEGEKMKLILSSCDFINENSKEEKNRKMFFPFKNEFIREQIKKSIISFDSKSKF